MKIILGLGVFGLGFVASQDPVQSADAVINCLYLFASLTVVMVIAYFVCWLHFVFKKDSDRIEFLSKAQCDMVINWNKLTETDTKLFKIVVDSLQMAVVTILERVISLRSQSNQDTAVLLPMQEPLLPQDTSVSLPVK